MYLTNKDDSTDNHDTIMFCLLRPADFIIRGYAYHIDANYEWKQSDGSLFTYKYAMASGYRVRYDFEFKDVPDYGIAIINASKYHDTSKKNIGLRMLGKEFIMNSSLNNYYNLDQRLSLETILELLPNNKLKNDILFNIDLFL